MVLHQTDRSKVPWTMNTGCYCVNIHTRASSLDCGDDNNISGTKAQPWAFLCFSQHWLPFYYLHCALLLSENLACLSWTVCYSTSKIGHLAFCIALCLDSFVLTLLLLFNSVEIWFSEPPITKCGQLCCFQNRKTAETAETAPIFQLLKGLPPHRFLGTGSLFAQKIGCGDQR